MCVLCAFVSVIKHKAVKSVKFICKRNNVDANNLTHDSKTVHCPLNALIRSFCYKDILAAVQLYSSHVLFRLQSIPLHVRQCVSLY